jgi:hypothetical protein
VPRITITADPVSSKRWVGDRPSVEGLYGTAFPLAQDLLITADHVISNVLAVASDFAVGWGSTRDDHRPGMKHPLVIRIGAV